MLGLDILWDRSAQRMEICNRKWNPLKWDEETKTWAEDGNVAVGPCYTDEDLENAEVLERHIYGDLTEIRLNLD